MLVSVIIPVYNSQETIVCCIESVLNQTYENYEIIIIDDGSQDNSINILKDFISEKSLSSLVRIFKQENQGPSAARNKGIEEAAGDYIAFLDSDDIWIAEKLSLQMYYFKNNSNLSVVLGSKDEFTFDKNINNKIISFKDMLLKNYFLTSSAIVKKADLKEANNFNINQKYSEDYRLALFLVYKKPAIFLNQILSKSILGKLSYGVSGLSANLWKMERGELSNFKELYQNKMINFFTYLKISIYSLIKYVYRLFNSKILK